VTEVTDGTNYRRPQTRSEQSDLAKEAEDVFYGGGQAPPPPPSPTPTPKPRK
jgi:hypothetical protein